MVTLTTWVKALLTTLGHSNVKEAGSNGTPCTNMYALLVSRFTLHKTRKLKVCQVMFVPGAQFLFYKMNPHILHSKKLVLSILFYIHHTCVKNKTTIITLQPNLLFCYCMIELMTEKNIRCTDQTNTIINMFSYLHSQAVNFHVV